MFTKEYGFLFLFSILVCGVSACRFQSGRQYNYAFHTTSHVHGVSAEPSFNVTCTVLLTAHSERCDVLLQVPECSFDGSTERGNDGIDKTTVLSRDMARYPVILKQRKFIEGTANLNVNNTINAPEGTESPTTDTHFVLYASPYDTVTILNLKRGIASAFQLPDVTQTLHAADFNKLVTDVVQNDVFGECPTHLTSTPVYNDNTTLAGWTVDTSRDLIMCNLSHVSIVQRNSWYFIKFLSGGATHGQISELLYPHESSVSCSYRISPYQVVNGSRCEQTQALDAGGSMPKRTLAHIIQTVELESVQDIPSGFDHDTFERDLLHVDWAMDMTEEARGNVKEDENDNIIDTVDGDAAHMEELLQRIVQDYLSQGEFMEREKLTTDLTSISFRRLVTLLRQSAHSDVSLLSHATFSCRGYEPCNAAFTHNVDVQSIRERLFTNALMSCGTNACMRVFTEEWLVGGRLLDITEEKSVITNMGMFYTPPNAVARTLLNYCKEIRSSWCWLPFSAMVHRMSEKHSNDIQTDGIIFDTIAVLQNMIGDNCRGSLIQNATAKEKETTEIYIATAVKSLINTGSAAHALHDQLFTPVNSNGTVSRSLLQCLRRDDLTVSVAKDAVKALQNPTPYVVSELLNMVKDEDRAVIIRAAILDVLLQQNDFGTLSETLALLQDSQMENVQTYLISQVHAILDSEDLESSSLRNTLQEVVRGLAIPKLHSRVLSQSQVTHSSRYITIPSSHMRVGGWVGTSIIYTPESRVLHSLTLSAGIQADTYKVKVIEVSLVIDGMDTLLNLLNKQSKKTSKKLKPSIDPLDILDILHKFITQSKKSEPPQLKNLHKKVRETLAEIFVLANLQKASFPRASFTFGTMGYQFVALSSDDILYALKSINIEDQAGSLLKEFAIHGLQSHLLRAFNFLDDRKVLPTISGLPLRNKVDIYFVSKSFLNIKSDAVKFLQGQKSDIQAGVAIKPSISFAVFTDLKVAMPEYTSVGVDASIYGELQSDWSVGVNVKPPTPVSDGVFSVEVVKEVSDVPLTFLLVKADSFTLKSGGILSTDQSQPGQTMRLCLPNIYTQLTGHKSCVQMVKTSAAIQHRDPLQPFTLRGYLKKEDGHLKFIRGRFNFKRTSNKKVNLDIILDGPGALLSRQLKVLFVKDTTDKSLALKCSVPDYNLEFSLEGIDFESEDRIHKRIASVLLRNGTAWNSFIYESKKRVNNNAVKNISDESSKHLNITVNGLLSLDLQYQKQSQDNHFSRKDITLAYYCDPRLQLLYRLHPHHSAASHGHRSQVSFHQELVTSPIDPGRASHVITLQTPVFNITSVTSKKLHSAVREATVSWDTTDGMDSIYTVSRVNNRSTSNVFLLDYRMNISRRNEYNISLDGHITGPRENPFANLGMHADISGVYTSTSGDNYQRKKRSVTSVAETLFSMEAHLESGAVSLYQNIRSRLLYMLNNTSPTHTASANHQQNQQSLVQPTPSLGEALDVQFQMESANDHRSLRNRMWNLTLDAHCSLAHRQDTAPEGARLMGVQAVWNVSVITPTDGLVLFHVNGTAYKANGASAYRKWMSLHSWDQLHHLHFDLWAEQRSNQHEWFHQHNWTLVETDSHSMDRSFSLRTHLQSTDTLTYNGFNHDVDLRSPRTNLSHHIGYVKPAPMTHRVRVYTLLHNTEPRFDLAYIEVTNITNGNVDSSINLTSTVLDWGCNATGGIRPGQGRVFNGHCIVNSRIPRFPGQRQLRASSILSPRRPPSINIVYTGSSADEIGLNVAMLGPRTVCFDVELPSNQTLMFNVVVIDSSRLQVTAGVPRAMLVHSMATKQRMRQYIGLIAAKTVGMLSQNILLNPKEMKLVTPNMTIQQFLFLNLQQKMATNNTKSVKLYRFALGVLDSVNELYIESPPVQAFRALQLDKAIAAYLRSKISRDFQEPSRPPAVVRQFYKIYGMKQKLAGASQIWHEMSSRELAHEMMGNHVTFNMSLPNLFALLHRNPLPRSSSQKCLLTTMKQLVTGRENQDRAIAMIMQGWSIRTFDRQMLNLKDPQCSSCKYLLGGDMKHGQFSFTYSRHGLTVSVASESVTLHRSGLIQSHNRIRHLPFTTKGGELAVFSKDSHIVISVNDGLASITLSPTDDFYMVEIDATLHNASIGLLGTNNREKGDDFKLPNGSRIRDSGLFQNSYELTGSSRCRVKPLPPTRLCPRFDISRQSHCMSMSDQWPETKPCLMAVDSIPFLMKCQSLECSGRSGCPAVSAYLTECRRHGIQVSTPPVCDQCEEANPSSLDLVIVHSLHHSLSARNGHHQHPLAWTRRLVRRLAKSYGHNINVGLVTHGGDALWERPRTALLHGKLLQNPHRAQRYLGHNYPMGKNRTDASAAILAASELPFHKDAAKIIFLVHEGQPSHQSGDSTQELQKTLTNRGISLVVTGPYNKFSASNSLGQWSSGQVLLQGVTTNPPQDDYSKLVKATGGFWIDWNTLRGSLFSDRTSSRSYRFRRFMRASKINVLDTVVSSIRRLESNIHANKCHL